MKATSLILTFGLLVISLGCGKGAPDYVNELVPFQGKVMFQGQPLSDATVTFLSKDGQSRETSAVTGPDGTYRLSSDRGFLGAMPGEYDVVISKFVTPDGKVPPPDVAPMDIGAEEVIPPKFSSAASISLRATIPAGGGKKDFDL